MHLFPVFPDLKAVPVFLTEAEEFWRAMSCVRPADASSRHTL
ncbi:hypothetical protein [Bradyrhizobium guangdongense]|nr:hypothetical protein [Bradyrhizobium guangdongense]